MKNSSEINNSTTWLSMWERVLNSPIHYKNRMKTNSHLLQFYYYYYYFEKQTHTKGRGKMVQTQRHITAPLL